MSIITAVLLLITFQSVKECKQVMNKTRHWWILLAIALVVIIGVLLRKFRHNTYEIDQTITAAPSDCNDDLRFAVIGDFGDADRPEADVAALIHSWKVDLIVTTGNNNYAYGQARTIDRNIGQYFAEFIHPYKGDYGTGGTENHFILVPGNHDWRVESLQPHYDYFTLPGNERYYDFNWGPVHFFMLDSDPHEPDGRTLASVQAAWFEEQIASASAPWKLVTPLGKFAYAGGLQTTTMKTAHLIKSISL